MARQNRSRKGQGSWGRKVRARFHGVCAACGSCVDVEAHHPWPVGEYPALEDVVDVGVALCKSCHIKEHATGSIGCDDLLWSHRARVRCDREFNEALAEKIERRSTVDEKPDAAAILAKALAALSPDELRALADAKERGE